MASSWLLAGLARSTSTILRGATDVRNGPSYLYSICRFRKSMSMSISDAMVVPTLLAIESGAASVINVTNLVAVRKIRLLRGGLEFVHSAELYFCVYLPVERLCRSHQVYGEQRPPDSFLVLDRVLTPPRPRYIEKAFDVCGFSLWQSYCILSVSWRETGEDGRTESMCMQNRT